jgi:hypothetical protein
VKKLPLLITVVILILSIGGYFLYKTYFVNTSVEPWALVPESSVLVYESGKCESCLESTKQSAIWKVVMKASFYSRENDSLRNIFKFLTDSRYDLVSVHVTKRDDFDFVFYNRVKPKSLDPILQQWKRNRHFRFSEREFNSVKINEVSCNNQVFSWILIDDIWVGSFTPFLIEDVIRAYESKNERTFKNIVSDVYQLPKMKKDAGNLYIHLKNFSEWLNIFTANNSASFIRDFGKSSILDIKIAGNNFILNGFSSDSVNKSEFLLSVFTGQTPVPFNLKNFISNRTVLLTCYGISNGENFGKDLMALKSRNNLYNDTLQQMAKSIQFSAEKLFSSIKGEIGLCFVESNGNELSKILLVRTDDSKKWTDAFNLISTKTSIDTVFYEKYAGYEIRELPTYRFQEKMFGPLVTDFDKSYYTSIGNVIIIGERLEELKRFLEDIDREETWGKAVSQNKFLETTLLESNISTYINTPRIWNVISNLTTQKWKNFISENAQLLQSIDMSAIQFSHLNESFYTNVILSYHASGDKEMSRVSDKSIGTNFESNITKMFVVKNHSDKHDEILVQDSLNTIHLISTTGKALWSKSIGSKITDDVKQIDFFNNGKLQYFFVADNKIHIIDRLGNYLTGYPVDIPVNDVEFVSVIDYDHSKKYRFLIASKSGSLWMFDKDGNNLDGWKPKELEGEFVFPPQHHRLRGKDYILAVRKDGNVFLINRRGETLKNFPVNVNGRPAGDYFIESGDNRSSTFFVFVTVDGFRVKVNLDGKIQSREALVKISPEAQFGLIAEQRNKSSYLIERQESKQLTLLDENGKSVITNDYVGLNPVTIAYLDLGAGNVFIVITDTLQNLSFVYDKNGSLLTTPPLESSWTKISQDGSEKKPKIFSYYQKAVSIQKAPQ